MAFLFEGFEMPKAEFKFESELPLIRPVAWANDPVRQARLAELISDLVVSKVLTKIDRSDTKTLNSCHFSRAFAFPKASTGKFRLVVFYFLECEYEIDFV